MQLLFEDLIHSVVNKMIIQFDQQVHICQVLGIRTKRIISMTDNGLVECIQCNKMTGTIVERIRTLIEVRTPVD